MNRFKFRLIIFVVIAAMFGWAWQHFRGMPFGNVSPWAGFPADLPAVLEYPDYKAAFRADSVAIAADFVFAKSLQPESELLGRVLGIWSPQLKALGKVSLMVGVNPAGSGKCSFSLILDTHHTGFDLEPLLRRPEIRRVLPSVYQGHKIYTVYLANRETFAVAVYRNLLVVAVLPLLVEEAIGRLEWRPSALNAQQKFRRILPSGKEGRNAVGMRLYIQPAQLPVLLSGIIHPEGMPELRRWSGLADWVRLDLQPQKSGWNIGGALSSPQQSGWASATQNRPQILLPEHLEVIPDNTALLLLASVSNWSRMPGGDTGQFRRYVSSWAGRELAIAMAQPRGIKLPSDWFVVIQARNKDLAERRLSELAAQAGTLKDYNYQSFRVRQVMTDRLLPLMPAAWMENPFFVFLGDYVVFASSQAALEVWIDAFISGKTLARDESFLPLYAQGKQPGAWYFYLPADKIKPLLQSYAPQEPQFSQLTDVLGTIAIRANAERGSWMLQGSGLRQAASDTHSAVAWKALLSAPALSAPFAIDDVAGNQTCIAVQDSSFRLYLIGPTGEIRWTKALDGPLLSDVQRMDYYGDGGTNLLMNTAHNIYLLDMQGNEVGNFPLPLQSPATNGVTVVNFDQGLQICFFVACANGNLYGFDRLGRPLPGWNPLSGAGTLRFPVLHFYKNDNDYLVTLNDKSVMKIYRRDGGERMPPKSLSGIFLSRPDYQVSEKSNRIVAVNASGVAHVIGLKDEFFRLSCPVGQGKGVRFAFGELTDDERKDYVVLSGEELALYAYGQGANFEQVFVHRFETAMDEVFCVRFPGEQKDRIGAVSREAGKIYLLDEKGILYPGFPLAGHSAFFIADLYQNNRPVVVSVYGDSVYAYQIR